MQHAILDNNFISNFNCDAYQIPFIINDVVMMYANVMFVIKVITVVINAITMFIIISFSEK